MCVVVCLCGVLCVGGGFSEAAGREVRRWCRRPGREAGRCARCENQARRCFVSLRKSRPSRTLQNRQLAPQNDTRKREDPTCTTGHILSLSNLSPPHSKKTPHQRHHPPRRHPHSLGLAILKAGQHVLHLHALLALLLELFCQLLHLRGKREKKKRVWGFSGANLFWWAWDAHLLLRRGARHTDHARRPP